jgi:hypothetical protein
MFRRPRLAGRFSSNPVPNPSYSGSNIAENAADTLITLTTTPGIAVIITCGPSKPQPIGMRRFWRARIHSKDCTGQGPLTGFTNMTTSTRRLPTGAISESGTATVTTPADVFEYIRLSYAAVIQISISILGSGEPIWRHGQFLLMCSYE